MSTEAPDTSLSINEVAAAVGLTREGVSRAIHAGLLTARKVYDHWRIEPADVTAWRAAADAKTANANKEDATDG